MNILYVTHSNSLAGANRSLISLIEGLLKTNKEIHITVLIPYGKDAFKLDTILTSLGCNVICAKYSRCVRVGKDRREWLDYYIYHFRYYLIYRRIRAIGYGIDVIHTNGSVCDVGAYLAEKFDVPHIWHFREVLEYYEMSLIRPLKYREYLSKNTTIVIAISKYIAEYIASKFGAHNIRVVYNGFEMTPYNTRVDTKNRYNLLIAGALYRNKGHVDAIEALSKIVHEYNNPNVYLYIVGTTDETADYESYLRNIIDKEEIGEHVFFMPFMDDLGPIRNNSLIALQCSIMEGMGRVTIESMISGLLVIGANSGATSELIDDGINGWLYEPGNAEDLAKTINYVINYKDKETVRRKAYLYSKEKFANEIITKQIQDIYYDIFKKNNKGDI